MRMTRRQMLVGLLGLGAGAGLPWPRRAGAAAAVVPGSPFEPERRRALAAALERILPGAIDAGVPEFIDYWLAREPFSLFLEPQFRIGAVHLDRIARKQHQRAFADCGPEQQNAILKRFEKGELKAKNFQSKPFFEHLVRLTLEGFLGDPRYGGNRDRVGWKFIGRPEGHPGCWWEPRNVDLYRSTPGALPW